ncbi:MAG: diadenylate cyclase CdaA [Clostridia bacterium]|nr:diadenylate cyclase CdaA [Clostridia bacterium]
MLKNILYGFDLKDIITDVLDITIIAVLLYYLVMFLKDRRAGKLVIGVGLMFVLHLVSESLGMVVVHKTLENIFENGIILLTVLFQPELRSVLEKMGGQSLKSLRGITEIKDNTQTLHMIDEVTEAVVDMSKSKTGALIAIERTTKLGDVILTGTTIDANPEAFLLKNIFFNKSPLHDGAVIIRNDRVYAAGCLLPLSVNTNIIKDLGTRHRAGIGMSENSDAVVIIVSEETGTISVAQDGKLERNFDKETLSSVLKEYLIGENENGVRKAKLTLNRFSEKRTDNKKHGGEDGK